MPEGSSIPQAKAYSETESPSCNPIDEPSTWMASGSTVKDSSRFGCSSTIIAPIILVVLAIARRSWMFCPHSTRPVVASITM